CPTVSMIAGKRLVAGNSIGKPRLSIGGRMRRKGEEFDGAVFVICDERCGANHTSHISIFLRLPVRITSVSHFRRGVDVKPQPLECALSDERPEPVAFVTQHASAMKTHEQTLDAGLGGTRTFIL